MNFPELKRTDDLIVVLTPTGRDGRLACDALIKAGFQAEACTSASDLGCRIRAGIGAALVAEEALTRPDIALLKNAMETQPAWSDFPFLIFTNTGEETLERQTADDLLGELGNITLLERPVRLQTMLSAMKSVMRARRRQYQVRDLLQQVNGFNEALEKRVEDRTAALTDATEQMEAFAYSVSHDLRAPLRSIYSFSEILLTSHGDQLDASGRDYLQRILKSARYMDALTQDLLAYSRLSRAEFSLQGVELEGAIAHVLYQMAEEIRAKHAKVVVEKPLPLVLAHNTPLEQILTNLLSNALKFSRAGTAPEIVITAEELGRTVRLYVKDNGIGIAPQFHERIFNLFERLTNGNIYPGTGMGLAIVKKAVERMNGRCGLESTPNEGSRFWIELPKAPAEVEAPRRVLATA